MNNEIALIYAPYPNQNVQKMKVALIRMGVRIQMVEKDMLDQKLCDLLKLSEEELNAYALDKNDIFMKHENENDEVCFNPEEFHDVVLVMYQFTSRKIDQMLLNFRKSKIPKVNLKAVVTKHNIQWKFHDLIEELMREHKAYNS